ncbi:MAG: hypothetical protein AAGD96_09375, partial [Chloroflexota bacterium]
FIDGGDFLSDSDISEGKRIITRLGIALFNEDLVEVNKQRLLLEDTYFQNINSADYEIVFIDVNPVEKYTLESFTSERVVSQFSHPMADVIALDLP